MSHCPFPAPDHLGPGQGCEADVGPIYPHIKDPEQHIKDWMAHNQHFVTWETWETHEYCGKEYKVTKKLKLVWNGHWHSKDGTSFACFNVEEAE